MTTTEDNAGAAANGEAPKSAPKSTTAVVDAPASSADNTSTTANASSTTKDGSPSSSTNAPQPSNKKRRSDIQLNKDDHPEGHTCNSDDDDDLNDEGGNRSDPFKRASDDVLKNRKIVKASAQWSSGGNGSAANGGGTFASVKLVAPSAPAATEISNDKAADKSATADNKPPTSIFGSSNTVSLGFGSTANKSDGGFGSGFGSVSSGFGTLKSSTETGFGSLKSSTTSSFGFGSSKANDTSSSPDKGSTNGSGLAGTFADNNTQKSNPSSPSSKFPTSSVVDTANGEQDEDCMCQVRAKLFKMVPEDETETDAVEDKKGAPCVPSTSGRMELVKKNTDGSPGGKGNESSNKTTESTTTEGPKLVQKEAGIGPVRILKRKISVGSKEEGNEKQSACARVVQRQETSGGQATKVILNIRLDSKSCTVIRRGDKFVQLNAPNSNSTVESSLFKVKTMEEADTLENNLKEALGVVTEKA